MNREINLGNQQMHRENVWSTIYNGARNILGDPWSAWTDDEIEIALDVAMEEARNYNGIYRPSRGSIRDELHACRQRARDSVVEAESVYGID